MIKIFDINKKSGSTYFVSFSTGNDSNTLAQAKNPATPWKTINKVNSSMGSFVAGDSVLFKRGDVFSASTLTPTISGISGKTFTLGAYGVGPKPKITGMVNITGWSSLGNNLYSATVPANQGVVNIVTLGGTLCPIGRWPKKTAPDEGYLNIDATNTQTTITSSSLVGNFVGATVVARVQHWVISPSTITAQTGTQISFPRMKDYTIYPILVNWGFFIQNHISGLTQTGDWMFVPSTNKITMYSSSGTPTNVQVATTNQLLACNGRSFLELRDLEFEGCTDRALEILNGNGLYIYNCDVNLVGTDAIFTQGISNFNMNGSSIKNALSYGLRINASGGINSRVTYNTFENIAHIAGMAIGGNRTSEAIQALLGSNQLISNNIFRNIGYQPIIYYGDNITIKNNFFDTFCVTKDDGGAIYSWIGNSSKVNFNRVINNNIIINGIGSSGGKLI